jgi:hypothetical protein
LTPLGLFLRTSICVAFYERLPTRLNPLAERTRFSQVSPSRGMAFDDFVSTVIAGYTADDAPVDTWNQTQPSEAISSGRSHPLTPDRHGTRRQESRWREPNSGGDSGSETESEGEGSAIPLRPPGYFYSTRGRQDPDDSDATSDDEVPDDSDATSDDEVPSGKVDDVPGGGASGGSAADAADEDATSDEDEPDRELTKEEKRAQSKAEKEARKRAKEEGKRQKKGEKMARKAAAARVVEQQDQAEQQQALALDQASDYESDTTDKQAPAARQVVLKKYRVLVKCSVRDTKDVTSMKVGSLAK